MLWHSRILGQSSVDEINGDRARLTDPVRLRDAKANLAKAMPILWPRCAAALEGTFDGYYDERVARKAQPAVELLLRHVHLELDSRLGEHLDRKTALELVSAQKAALDVLFGLHGSKGAKERFIAISDGRPLRVCTGSTAARYVDVTPRNSVYTDEDGVKWRISSKLRPAVTYAAGCLIVFEDHSGTQSKMWPTWCDEHTKRLNPSANPTRDADRAVRKRLAEYWGERVAAHVRSAGPH